MEAEKVEQETEWIPILKYVKILSEKGIAITVGSVANGMAIGSVRAKRDDGGKWWIDKQELVKRIKASGKKLEPIEAGYYSLYGFIYALSEHGIDMDEDQVSHLGFMGSLTITRDKYGRHIIPAHELVKRVEQFGTQR